MGSFLYRVDFRWPNRVRQVRSLQREKLFFVFHKLWPGPTGRGDTLFSKYINPSLLFVDLTNHLLMGNLSVEENKTLGNAFYCLWTKMVKTGCQGLSATM